MDEELVAVATFSTEPEAHLARIRLEEDGIESIVSDGVVSNINWLYTQAIGGVKVMVREADAERAHDVLERVLPAEPVEAEEGDGEPETPAEAPAGPVCLVCGSHEITGTRRRLGWTALALVLLGPIGLIIYLLVRLVLKETYTCDECGFVWEK